jgi:hypothetical protein
VTVIKGKALTTFDVASDGHSVSINVLDEQSDAGSLVLPTDCLGRLIMTLPEMMRQTLQRQNQGDCSLRLVYPADGWEVEQSEQPGLFILTLRAPGGFHVSFGVTRADLEGMSDIGGDAAHRKLRH